MSVSVVIHEKSTPAQVAAVRSVVREFDNEAEVSATYSTKAIDPVSIFLISLAAPFAAGFAGKAGADAWDSLRELVQRLRAAAEDEAQVVLEDSDGVQVILGATETPARLLQLPEDVRGAAGEYRELYWDSDDGCWKSPS